ncbi:hypothetical protein [Pararhodobacter zhoushanensis]|uniref:DUF2066 domain-containing protein n=1 Tax=Pararhodobacter zhoushanensis TaxID=2479545 RepID=A0ABT3GZK5_9RHOB|nr:hypothetical protein [Pararhodobacter zhoushanensis]MCW1932910.1 hypothetical protein [Pararhodobacter zhoushanensis]
MTDCRFLTRFLRRTAPRFAAVLGLVLAAQAVPATTPPPLDGATDAVFTQALDAWLADDEASALPAFSRLAVEGNTAARLLLGVIDKSPALQGPFLAQMPRHQRISLLRLPGGMSGQSWLRATSGIPLADAWVAMLNVRSGPDVVLRFEDLGESRAAREALMVLSARGHPDLAQLDPQSVPQDMLYLLWRRASAARKAEVASFVPADHPQWLMMGETLGEGVLQHWLETSDAAAPLSSLCRSICAPSVGSCVSAAYAALGSHDALMTLGTPAAALVDQTRFVDSARGHASVLRRIMLGTPMRGRRMLLARVSERSECLGNALSSDDLRYRPQIPGVSPVPLNAPEGG